jgi:hypothetical protein
MRKQAGLKPVDKILLFISGEDRLNEILEKNKTLIGKDGILFLQNDASKELEVHCNNLINVFDTTLSRFTFKNFMIFVYPNKCVIYKDFLPDQYIFKYRPAIEIYKEKFKDNFHDLYEILKNETNTYYKTDTHINSKGNYLVYKYFIDTLKIKFGLNIEPKRIDFEVKTCELKTLQFGLGDLTWETNLGNQNLTDAKDTFFFDEFCMSFYCKYVIKNDNFIRFLDYDLVDKTLTLENEIAGWDLIGKYIIHTKNEGKIPLKVLFFYDSFLLHVLPLYLDLFNETYFVKAVYSNEVINAINPDYVFEFRIERFLF